MSHSQCLSLGGKRLVKWRSSDFEVMAEDQHLETEAVLPKKSLFRDFVLIGTNVQIWSRKRPDLPLKSQSCLIGHKKLYIGPKLLKFLLECKNSPGLQIKVCVYLLLSDLVFR